jgi:hypothetical protein
MNNQSITLPTYGGRQVCFLNGADQEFRPPSHTIPQDLAVKKHLEATEYQ